MTKLTFALPSKGRLQEQAFELFEKAGLAITRGNGGRGYRGTMDKMPDVDVLLLSASEIAAGLASGDIHLGITGEDLMREATHDFDASIHLLKALGFGGADVVVAVPESWIDVWGIADLRDVSLDFFARHKRRMRVATKYANLAHDFFNDHGLTEYRVVYSHGATEAAPSSGAAELIVDITSTGSTLRANDLKTIDGGTILKSEAQLAASCKASWDEGARAQLSTMLNTVAPTVAGDALSAFFKRVGG